jgi:hypothetical protein
MERATRGGKRMNMSIVFDYMLSGCPYLFNIGFCKLERISSVDYPNDAATI